MPTEQIRVYNPHMLAKARYGLLAVLLLASSSAQSQSPTLPLTDWNNLNALHAGETLKISDWHHSEVCEFATVDDTYLSCDHTRFILFFPFTHRATFKRSEVRSVRESRVVLSTVSGAAIGAAAGAGIGFGLEGGSPATVSDTGHLLGLFFTVMGAYLGAAIGQHSDFLAGRLLYRAP